MSEHYRALDEVYIRRNDCEQLIIRALDNWLDRRRHTPEAYEIVNEILDIVEERNSERVSTEQIYEQEVLADGWYGDSFDS